ncbi:MAG: DUF4389 domain-containing protein [Solirubrobacteraceae bacterium]
MGAAVQVDIPRPERSSRLKMIFRGFLVIPVMIFALPVLLVAVILMLLNYLVVLVTGRAAFFGFLSGTLRFLTRLNAYMYLLTDKYPPFSLGDAPDYPVRVQVAPPGKIHRWRVLSYLLALPHIVVLYVLFIVSAITTLISAIVILFVGRYPAGLFGISAATMRYQARVNAYIYLITDSYPPFSLA